MMQFLYPLIFKEYKPIYFMTESTILNHLGLKAPKAFGGRGGRTESINQ